MKKITTFINKDSDGKENPQNRGYYPIHTILDILKEIVKGTRKYTVMDAYNMSYDCLEYEIKFNNKGFQIRLYLSRADLSKNHTLEQLKSMLSATIEQRVNTMKQVKSLRTITF